MVPHALGSFHLLDLGKSPATRLPLQAPPAPHVRKSWVDNARARGPETRQRQGLGVSELRERSRSWGTKRGADGAELQPGRPEPAKKERSPLRRLGQTGLALPCVNTEGPVPRTPTTTRRPSVSSGVWSQFTPPLARPRDVPPALPLTTASWSRARAAPSRRATLSTTALLPAAKARGVAASATFMRWRPRGVARCGSRATMMMTTMVAVLQHVLPATTAAATVIPATGKTATAKTAAATTTTPAALAAMATTRTATTITTTSFSTKISRVPALVPIPTTAAIGVGLVRGEKTAGRSRAAQRPNRRLTAHLELARQHHRRRQG